MARTAVTPTVLTVNGSATEPAATNTVSGTGNGITIAASTPEQTIFRVTATNAGNVIIKAGAGAAAISAGQGDLTVALGAGAVAEIGPFESARFGQADGSLNLETSAVMAVQTFKVNRH